MPAAPTASPPLFSAPRPGPPPGARAPTAARPERPATADGRTLSRAPGRRLQTRVAGIFLFLPLLARLPFEAIVRPAGYPGTRRIPAPAALVSLRALNLLDQERRSHIDAFNCDAALGLFAGLNIVPKKAFLTAQSYRTRRPQPQALLTGWVQALAPLLVPEAKAFSLDFPPLPQRGDSTGLDRHYIPCQGKAAPSVLTFFALENDSRVLCYAHANLTRIDQPGELMRFVAVWHGLTGSDPQWLYFDSPLVPYAELSRGHERGIWFVTIRRRGASLLRRLHGLPASAWQQAVIDTPKRCHQHSRSVDEVVQLRDYTGPARHLAVDGLGHDEPTLFLSNNVAATARTVIIRSAGRNRVEDGLGTAVNFFHLDCLASEVRLNVDLDTVVTVLANGCQRWLGRHLRGFEKAAPKQWYRRFVETAGPVVPEANRSGVPFDRRCHNPLLREAARDRDPIPIPWCHGRPIAFSYL